MLGAFDKDTRQPKEPTYAISNVIEKGTHLPDKGQCNYAVYIDETGY